ncbi:MAG: hemerythrin domain-containing protein [Spartobacteria bacterium]
MLLAHDHSELDAALGALFSALADEDVERSFKNLDLFWARLAMHIRAENIHLFPLLLKASRRSGKTADVPALGRVEEIIAQLRADHDFFMTELTAAMKQLRELRRSDRHDAAPVLAKVRQQMTRLRRRFHTHNALEESEAYQWAGSLLASPEQTALKEKLQRELDNLPPRFRAAGEGGERPRT